MDTVNNVLDFQKLDAFSGVTTGKRLSEAAIPEDEAVPTGRANSPSILDKSLVHATDMSMLVQEVTDGVCLGHEFKGLSTGKSTTSDAGHQSISVAHVDKVSVILDIHHRPEGWRFLANQSAIKRIISNLVGNALKYSKESGWVRVALGLADSPAVSPIDNSGKVIVKLVVQDSGKGMGREFLKTKLFTPFSQENPLSAGAGLGLCIVRQLVQLLDGKINIKSKLDEGTEVSVYLPLTPLEGDGSHILKVPRVVEHKLRAVLTGFDSPEGENPSLTQAKQQLRDSIQRYLFQFFDVESIDIDMATRDPRGVFIVCNGASEETAAVIARVSELSEGLKAAPIVLLCNRSAYTRPRSKSLPFKNIEQRIAYVRKPYGPKRLLNALTFCADVMKKNDRKPSSPILDVSPLSKISESTVLDLAIGLRDVVLTPPESTTRQNSLGMDLVIPGSASGGISPRSEDPSAISRVAYMPFSETPPIVSNFQHSNITTASPPEYVTDGPAILCVEDNQVNMMLLTKFLKKKSYTFATALNGVEAVSRVQERSPGAFDVILMDLRKFTPILANKNSTNNLQKCLCSLVSKPLEKSVALKLRTQQENEPISWP